jgi:pantetheine-phosphate adenylyltransferase
MSAKIKILERIAVYPGTFDPITLGHVDLVRRMLPQFSRIIIVVAKNSWKKTLFSASERMTFIKKIFENNPKIEVMIYGGLIVDLMDTLGASIILRGLRAVSDFEYELQMALTNRTLNSKVETVFVMPDAKYIYLNSSTVKEVARFSRKLTDFVSPVVAAALHKKFKIKKAVIRL